MTTKLFDYTFNTSTYVFGVPLVLANVGQEVDKGVKGSDDGVEGNSCIESITSVGVIALGTLGGLNVVASMTFCCFLKIILQMECSFALSVESKLLHLFIPFFI
jgi:hypothetical protein